MIVKPCPEGWEIIFQRAHGQLAGQIAFHWRKDMRPVRWFETLLAIAEHDDAQEDFEGKNFITPAGSPTDFTMKEFSLEQQNKVCDYSKRKSGWIGLLVSMHMSFLYNPKKGIDNELKKFLEDQEKQQRYLRKSLNVTKDESVFAYELLQWCDALSLLICKDLVQEEERKIEIGKGPDGIRYFIWKRKKDASLIVEPWCFEDDQFDIFFESRTVKQLYFKDDFELQKLINQSKADIKKMSFVKHDE